MTDPRRGAARPPSSPRVTVLSLLSLLAVAGPVRATINFEPPALDDGYVSRADFDAKGLQPVYDAAHGFARVIQKENPLPPDLLDVLDGRVVIKHVEPDWNALALYYDGVLAVLLLGVAVALLFPLAALLWCCRALCCVGGARSTERDGEDGDLEVPAGRYAALADPADPHKRRGRDAPCVRPLLLAALTGAALVGAVLAVAANAYLTAGIGALPDRLRDGVADVHLFVNNTETEVDTLMIANYRQLAASLQDTVKTCQIEINEMISSITEALPLQTLTDAVNGFTKVKQDLEGIKTESEAILESSTNIANGIRLVGSNVMQKCGGGSGCLAEVTAFNNGLATPEFPTFENVTESINLVTDVVSPDFVKQLTEGQQALLNFGPQVQRTLGAVLRTVSTAIDDTGAKLQDRSEDLKRRVQASSRIFDDADDAIRKADGEYVKPYAEHRFYAFLALSLIPLVISATIAVGLLVGCCTERHSYGVIRLGLWLMSLTVTVLLLAITALFALSLVADRMCEAAREPADNQIVALIDKLVEDEARRNPLPLHNVSYYVTACRADQPLYQVLDLDPQINIGQILDYLDEFDDVLKQYLSNAAASEDTILQVELITPDIMSTLVALKDSPVAKVDYDQFRKEIHEGEETLQHLRLTEWASSLEKIGETAGLDVHAEADVLRGLESWARELKTRAQILSGLVDTLQADSGLGHESFAQAVEHLLGQVGHANDTIHEAAPRFVRLADSEAQSFRDKVEAYLKHAVDRVKHEALRCGPLSRAYDAAVAGLCDDVLQPLTGYWAGAGFSLLLFVPIGILGATLT